jgi:hypothetical protein
LRFVRVGNIVQSRENPADVPACPKQLPFPAWENYDASFSSNPTHDFIYTPNLLQNGGKQFVSGFHMSPESFLDRSVPSFRLKLSLVESNAE